ncbi:hypothetical protein A3F00_03795 [Candidatus Daviesbacteria bacterium RIFCSPHIGHO2_12_FULL_37_11]|uniref:Nudix hydrolase domain-containing protein n=1 Tax=Candidatus Daviesbacteria bacterium RIFCSPHIGHO2_12_FULL_37_11 TaxID=1797777 RepID=A0A1F5KB75_9BACT|nr:MAG: hypothetical protein A3F00_03795 [Candidatus Daviesbacteria bacterium RIFCSPHIGHO2_12_FULL_37_11]OGE45875.1 MAG: hypothetical protein A3B39_01580 [Candidatus Daviesbacteria bacterium RIFCSPLOWO2_01_FULL_37_10]
MPKKLPIEVYKEIYSKVPRLCAELLIKNKEGILLVKRNIPPGEGLWYLPGGTIYFDESIEEVLKRVAKEELGVKVEIIRFFNVLDWYKSENAFGHSVSLIYEARIVEGEIKLDYQSSEFKYFKNLPENIMNEYLRFDF